MSIYKHHAPSTTSLSDDADDGDEEPQFAFYADYQPSPAQWVNKAQRSTLRPLHSPISNMPPEVLISILKHLHAPKDLLSCLRVSRAWCECTVELLWHKPTFPKYGTVHKMANLLRKPHPTFTYARFIRRLNFLNLGNDLMDDLLSVFAQCDRLERLTLIGCKHVSSDLLARLLPCFNNLVALDMTGVVHTTSESIIGLASVAFRLQGINLAGCERVTDAGIIALAQSCPLLRRVKLTNLTNLTDASVVTLAESCPMLLELDLTHCELITDASVRLIWTNLNNMRELRLPHCPLLTDAAFPSPLRQEAHVIEGPNPFPTFRRDEELPPLILNKTFEHLRMLDLTACILITDDAVEGIISHAPKIRNLVLSKCTLLTDKAVESICKLGRYLHYLHLGHAKKITDRSVRLLARSCTRIRYIDFANCEHLTDLSVFELAQLTKLRRVGLVRVNQLTDEAIYALAERHATLERIHLSYCDQISVMAIHFLLLKLHKLTHLSLTGVPSFRQPELQQFCREAPKDFNTAQRMAFCVYSGKGVSQLRAYLTELFDRITENNHTDDTEYEEDGYDGEAYQDDDTPEPDDMTERAMDVYPTASTHNNPMAGPSVGPTPLQEDPTVVPHEFAYQRERPVRANSMPSSTPYHHQAQHPTQVPHSPSANLRGAATRLNTQIHDSTPTARRPRAHGPTSRSIADAFPVVEAPLTPVPRDAIAAVANLVGTPGNGFFRAYHQPPPPPEDAIMMHVGSPELNYAEIGLGRGQIGANARYQAAMVRDHRARERDRERERVEREHAAQVRMDVDPVGPAPEPPQSGSSRGNSESEDEILTLRQIPRMGPPNFIPNSSHVVHEPPRSAPVTEQRGRSEHRDDGSAQGDGRARSVKRSIKSTFVAAEHFFFGRHPGDMTGEPSNSGASSGRPPAPR